MIRKTFSVPPLGCNCSIIGDPITRQAIVVDPGGAPERILQEVRAMGLTVVSILHTHAHFDHFLASGAMKQATGALLCLHPDDRPLWDMLETQCRMFGVPYVPAPPPDYWLTDEDRVMIGEPDTDVADRHLRGNAGLVGMGARVECGNHQHE